MMDEEKVIEEKKKRKAAKIAVTVIKASDKSSLVEFIKDGNIQRVYIPSHMIDDGMVEDETLEIGIPYGIPWETLLTPSATPASLAKALRSAGIWTLEDVQRKPSEVSGALQTAYGIDRAMLLEVARNFEIPE